MRTRRLTLGCRRAGRGAIVPIRPGTSGETVRDPADDAFPDSVAGLFPPGAPWDGLGHWPADDAAGPSAGQAGGGGDRARLPSAGRDPRWRGPAGRVLTARELRWNTNPGWPAGLPRSHVVRGRHARPRLLTARTATLIVAACTAVVLLLLSLLP